MPNYVSKGGVWYPAKEKVGLTNLSGKTKEVDGKKVKHGDPYVYEGPDRAALFELYQIDQSGKTTTLGQDFKTDPEFINRVRQLGFKDVDEYLKSVGYDPEQVEVEFKKKARVVNKHELPERVKEIETLGGGKDFSGQGKDVRGGFGQPQDLPT